MSSSDERYAVEAFASAYALLSTPFSDRAAVLSTLGHSESSWQALHERMRELLAGDPRRELARHFRAVFERARSGSTANASPVLQEADVDTDATLPINATPLPIELLRALPFEPVDEPALSRRFVMERQRERATGTVMASASMARSTLPFDKRGRAALAEPKNVAGWTVEQYAALCIDLHVSGRAEAEVLASAKITREQYVRLDAFWEQEMHREPALRDRWTRASEARREELASTR